MNWSPPMWFTRMLPMRVWNWYAICDMMNHAWRNADEGKIEYALACQDDARIAYADWKRS